MRHLCQAHRIYLFLAGSLIITFLVACGGTPQPTTIQITADANSIEAGETEQLNATETAFLIASDVTHVATWSSSDSAVATVSSSGLVTGVAAGSATITGTYSGAAGSLGLSIGRPAVTGILLSPAHATVAPGSTQQYAVTAMYANQTTGPLSGVTWSVLPQNVAKINSSGLLSALTSGPFVVSATYGAGVGPLSQSISGVVSSATRY